MESKQQTAAYLLSLMPALVGIVFALGTRWNPRGTLFGVTVGPAFAASPAAQRIVRRYRSANLGLGLLFSLIALLLLWGASNGPGREAVPLLRFLLYIQFAAGLGTWLQGWRSILLAAEGNPAVEEARKADQGWRLAGMIYVNPKDPAVFVPKRFGWGWTLNFARPTAWFLLFLPVLIGLVASLT